MKLGLLGYNIAYSKTPAIFEAIFDELGIVGETCLFDLPPNEFDQFAGSLRSRELTGMSVTIPYKQLCLGHLDQTNETARDLGAANSVKFDGPKLTGYNTDVFGFGLPLSVFKEKLSGKSVLVIGAGGAARAAVYALSNQIGLSSFRILGRDQNRLLTFTEQLSSLLSSASFDYGLLESGLSDSDCHSGLIVNCSPLGGPNLPDQKLGWDWSLFEPGTVYYDTNYNQNNLIVRDANEAGLVTIDGRQMLIGQALESFRIWTGTGVPFEPIYNRIFGAD
ncbi:MAG: hypothetical protein P1R58_05760 [bacterium]|nr:hypothetical protein [bacterium]